MLKKLFVLVLSILMCVTCLFGSACKNNADDPSKIKLDEEFAELKNADDVTWNKINWPENFKTAADAYDLDAHPAPINPKYKSYPFFSDKEDNVTYAANGLFDDYAYITTSDWSENFVCYSAGRVWLEWMGQIMGPYDRSPRWTLHRNSIINMPIMDTGYWWCWEYCPHWPTATMNEYGQDEHYHYDHMFRVISGIYQFMKWENSTALLDEVDTDTVTYVGQESASWYEIEKNHEGQDVSKGKTVRQKLDMAVNYILEDMHGKDGLIILDEKLNNGENLGRIGDASSNYWDNFLFGYKDAYENALFYGALQSLVGIETMCGNTQKADYYKDLMVTVKQKFNDTFWDASKYRYIDTVDVNGVKWDFGLTFLNTEALYYGLADDIRAKLVYTWLTGNVKIEGDRATGDNIYRYKIAPRASTVSMEDSVQEKVKNRYQHWYFDWYGVADVEGAWSYGQHFQNGGAIFYTSFYDIMSRIRYVSPESALNRWKTIADEYAKDQLCRRPASSKGNHDMLGVILEFPESGLVPVTWLYGFMGVDVDVNDVKIAPNIPKDYEYMGMDDLCFGGNRYKITTHKSGKVDVQVKARGGMTFKVIDAESKGTATLSINGGAGSTITAKNGYFEVKIPATVAANTVYTVTPSK